MSELVQMMQYLFNINIFKFPGGFNYYFLDRLNNKVLLIFTDHVQIAGKPTQLSGSDRLHLI